MGSGHPCLSSLLTITTYILYQKMAVLNLIASLVNRWYHNQDEDFISQYYHTLRLLPNPVIGTLVMGHVFKKTLLNQTHNTKHRNNTKVNIHIFDYIFV